MFKTYGTGSKGRKVEDLERFAGLIISLGMNIPEGIVILSDIFAETLDNLGLNEESSPEQLNGVECPIFLTVINRDILNGMLTGKPYAIRSTALSERGGTGIYQSTFFVPNGDRERDLQLLWEKEREVYASELSPDAKAWREKNQAPFGMAIFIQPVQGFEFDGYWLPSLSGVAYTSYQGLPTVRLVVGLGTQAVKGGGLIYNQDPDPNKPLHFYRDIWDLKKADTIQLQTGDIGQISSQYLEIHRSINFGEFCRFFEKLAKLKEHGDFSLEWVLVGDKIHIVQCAPYEDRLPGDMTVNKDRYFLLAQGADVYNSGRNVCQAVVYVHSWSPVTADRLENLNKRLTDYILIIPQDAISALAGIDRDETTGRLNVQFGFRHFSNAGAVIEKQIDYTTRQMTDALQIGIRLVNHSQGLGASHFQQLCSRSDILFIGTEFDATPLFGLAGQVEYGNPVDISVWQTEAVALVDGETKEGFVYIAKETKRNKYSPVQVEEYKMAMRRAANDANKDNNDSAGALYNIHYAIGQDGSPVDYDPFKLEEDIIDECGLDGIRRDLQVVIDNRDLVSRHIPNQWRNEFSRYLQDLLGSLPK
ncbi:MAG: hypothetical protein WC668_03135 [Patescibacteria group bacterium]|jgi:hypothetical protein